MPAPHPKPSPSPPWYKNPWSIAGLIAAVGGGIYAVIRFVSPTNTEPQDDPPLNKCEQRLHNIVTKLNNGRHQKRWGDVTIEEVKEMAGDMASDGFGFFVDVVYDVEKDKTIKGRTKLARAVGLVNQKYAGWIQAIVKALDAAHGHGWGTGSPTEVLDRVVRIAASILPRPIECLTNALYQTEKDVIDGKSIPDKLAYAIKLFCNC
jgi:hypothetical protein